MLSGFLPGQAPAARAEILTVGRPPSSESPPSCLDEEGAGALVCRAQPLLEEDVGFTGVGAWPDVAPGAEVVSSCVQQAVAARASQGLSLVVLGFCLGFLCEPAVPGTIAPAGVTRGSPSVLASPWGCSSQGARVLSWGCS